MERLLTIPEVAKALGVSVRTVRRLTRKGGELPAFRYGRAVRVDPRDLDDYIDRHTISGS